MKVLMLGNVPPLPELARAVGEPPSILGGWMTGLVGELRRDASVDLNVAFPASSIKDNCYGVADGVRFFAFPAVKGKSPRSQRDMSAPRRIAIARLLQEAQPDLLHIFGTEYSHSLIAVQEFDRPNATVVSVQGLMSVYAQHLVGNLPLKVQRKWVPSNVIRGDLIQQRQQFAKTGELEEETLRLVNHVSGRTDWDRACALRINPAVSYHPCDEILRHEFYGHQWSLKRCEPYSIFMSQSASPIKGLYSMLQALPDVLRCHPRAHLYVAGNDPTRSHNLRTRLSRSAYGKYLGELIETNELGEKVTFLGPLSAAEMRDRMLSSHVFVSASTVENESNSFSEARLLGLPSVVSFVGGVTSRVEHGVDCFAYQHDAPYMLAYYISALFSDPSIALRFSQQSRATASSMHNPRRNGDRMVEIYSRILRGG